MTYKIDSLVFERVPGFRRTVVTARYITNHVDLESSLGEHFLAVQEQVRANPAVDSGLSAWQNAYQAVGVNKQHRPSIVALVNRIRSGATIRLISPVVAIANIIAIRFLCPTGPLDRQKITGDIVLGPSSGQQAFRAIGSDSTVNPPAGELVLLDSGSGEVLCRGWSSRGGLAAAVEESTSSLLLDVDSLDSTDETHFAAVDAAIDLLRRYCLADEISSATLHRSCPSIEV